MSGAKVQTRKVEQRSWTRRAEHHIECKTIGQIGRTKQQIKQEEQNTTLNKSVTTLTLGLQPTQGHGKVQAKNATHSYTLGSVGECEGMSRYIPKWTPILGVRVPMDSIIFRDQLKGQNSLDQILLYTIEKILKHRCFKWVHMIHLSIYNTSYGGKKGRESKCQFDFWPLKVRNCLQLHACKKHATYRWKTLNKYYNFALDLTSIEGLYKKLRASKVARVPILGIVGIAHQARGAEQ